MSIGHSLAKNTVIQLVGKAVSTALGMVAFAIMARTLGVDGLGWYGTAVGFLQFVGLISDFGFTVTTSNLLAEPNFDKRTVLDVCFSWRFVTALIFQLIAPLVFLLLPYNHEIKLAVAVATVSFFALSLSQVFIGSFREGLAIHFPVIAELTGRVLLVAGIALVSVTHTGFLAVMMAVTVASIVSTLYLWRAAAPIRFNFDKTISRALWVKISPTALTVILNGIYLQGDRVLLPLYVNSTVVGFYSASYRVLDIIIQVASLVMGLIMPLITYAWSRGLKEEFRERLNLGFTTLALIMVPMATGVIVLAHPIIALVAGADFWPAGSLLAPLTVSMFGVVFGMAFGHVLLAMNRQRETVWVYGSCAALSLAGYLLLIPRFGAPGAVGVTIFSEWYTGLLLLILTAKYAHELPHFWPLAKILFAALVMAVVIYVLRSLSIVITIPLGACVYIVLIGATGVLTTTHVKQFFAGVFADRKQPVVH